MDAAPDPFFALGLSVPAGRHKRKALHGQIKSAILDGRLAPGLQLPASRALARALGLSRNSVIAVYDLLLGEGYILSRQGAGCFVAGAPPRSAPLDQAKPAPAAASRLRPAWRGQAPLPRAPTPPLPLSLRLGLPDLALFPHDDWRRLAGRARRRAALSPVGYADPYGSPALRQAVAGHVSMTRAVACRAEDILITHGAQQAFDLLAKVLVEPGRTVVAVEEPGYPPLRSALAAAGAVVRPTPVDEEGLIVEALPQDAAVVCVTPSHQFPLGVTMTPARRAALLAFAEMRDAVVIEDDYDGEFRFEARPLDALQTLDRSGRVVYVGTFSKCLSPDLRLGFAVCPPWALDALARAKQLSDWNCPLVEQEALADFIAEGGLARHVRRMRAVYGERRRVLLEALAVHCGARLTPFAAVAGLHIAARLAPGLDEGRVAGLAAREGLGLRAIGGFAAGAGAPQGFALAYGAEGAETIAAVVERLGAVLALL
jgi:GntR family transcriptional regulator/MocR family aminotransferase